MTATGARGKYDSYLMSHNKTKIETAITELLLEGPECTQTHTHIRLQQVELASFTLCDGSFVYCNVTSDFCPKFMGRRFLGGRHYCVVSIPLATCVVIKTKVGFHHQGPAIFN